MDKIRPTKLQKKAIEYIGEGESVSSAMRKAGYAAATAKNPSNLTDSPAYVALRDRIPDDLLIERMHDLLNKKETFIEIDPNTKEPKHVRSREIHVPAVSKGLEFGLRIKGVYNPEPTHPPAGNTYNFFYKPEIKATTDKYEEELKKILYGKAPDAQ